MKKLKYILKAVMLIGIVIAISTQGAAMIHSEKSLEIPKTKIISVPQAVKMNPGWEEQASGFWEPNRGIHYMHAVDENIVWAVGYDGTTANQPVQEFTRTINGGEDWEADVISGAPSDGDTAMIFALDENIAWVPIHSGTPQGIWKTSNGGDTWIHQTTAAFNGSGAFPNIVHFWNETHGWCQGDPVDGYYEMYTTTDGGNNWVRVPEENIPAPLPGEMGTVGYYDVVNDTVWFGTQSGGRVFKSTDNGYTWTVATTPFDAGAYVDIRFKDENNGIAMDKNFEVPDLAETSDGGSTWTALAYNGVCYGADFDYVPGSNNTYVSTGVNYLSIYGASYSYDGGHNWVKWSEMENIQLFGTTWVEGMIGWAGTFNEDEETGGVYKHTPEGDKPDIYCAGLLEWENVSKGSTQTGSFEIQNIGASGTLLDWNIVKKPSWGEWTFDPESGSDLESGVPLTINVTVIAPGEKNQQYAGQITVQNKDDPTDYCTIDVKLATPKNKPFNVNPFFIRFLENHPRMFPLLRQILGL